MITSDLIRGRKLFSSITTDLREPEDRSAGGTPTVSTWWKSVALFFDDVIACASAVAISGFAAKALGQALPRMRPPEEWSPRRRLKTDARTSWIGTPLGVSSIGELPQFIDVLRRDVSLLRPRPMAQQERREHFNFVQKGYLLWVY